jgi:hypothetical protein
MPFISSAIATAASTFCFTPTPVYTTFPSALTTTRYDVCGAWYAATAFPSRSKTNSPPRWCDSAYAYCLSGDWLSFTPTEMNFTRPAYFSRAA